jgi:hypothetical protein
VGRGYSELSPHRIVDSLKELHSHNILHGDARLANVVSLSGNPVWIDLCETGVAAIPLFFVRELMQLEEDIRKKFVPKFFQ